MSVGAWDAKHDPHSRFGIRWEMDEMLHDMRRRLPDHPVVLEIGTFQGDSLRVWCEEFEPSLLIGVQDTYETTPEVADEVGAVMVIGKSQDPETYSQVVRILSGRTIDLLYIDGDHMYPAVKRDWELYEPLVARGGIIVLHDAVIEDNPTVEVYQFYREIREGRYTKLVSAGRGSTGTAMVFV